MSGNVIIAETLFLIPLFQGHGAANVTLGIPRLREIVMTASTKPKTPSMTMVVNEDVPTAKIESFCKRASRLTLSQVIDNIVVTECLVVDGLARNKEFTIEMSFYPKSEYLSEYDVDAPEIQASFGVRFPVALRKEIQMELKRLDADLKGQIAEIGKGKIVTNLEDIGGNDDVAGGDDEGEAPPPRKDDEASEVGDGDAEEEKQRKKRVEMIGYEDDSDSDEELDEAGIEAKFTDEEASDGEGVENQTVGAPEAKTKAVSRTENLFLANCSAFATAFHFSSKGCKIGLSVR